MVMTKGRVWLLAISFVVASCVGGVAAPTPSETPSPTPAATATATARPAARTPDVLYVRKQPGGSPALIAVIDARTGATIFELPAGAMSSDRSLLYATESRDGATKTILRVIALPSGKEIRSFTLAGDLRVTTAGADEPSGLTPDGKSIVLRRFPVQIDGQWRSPFAVVDIATGQMTGSADLRATATYGYVGYAGGILYVGQYGDGPALMRAYDVSAQRFLPDPVFTGWDGRAQGYRTAFQPSADGRWLFAVDSGSPTTNCTSTDGPACKPNTVAPHVVALDLMTRRAARIALPADQISGDFEKYMLWSTALSPDGSTLYAVNPELGVVNEIDAKQMLLRRTGRLSAAPAQRDLLAALRQALFPVAEAKRILRGGAILSPDGRTLYAVGGKGIVVIDAASLAVRMTWNPWVEAAFESLALSPDGARLYAISDESRSIGIMDARDGALLGEIPMTGYLTVIVRVDTP